MPSLAIAFTGDKRIENLSNDLSSSASFSAKIDDRGRIYLPARIRQEFTSFSFFAAVAERRIFISGSGRYGVDSKGRVFVPADIRRSLGIDAGDIVRIEFGGR